MCKEIKEKKSSEVALPRSNSEGHEVLTLMSFEVDACSFSQLNPPRERYGPEVGLQELHLVFHRLSVPKSRKHAFARVNARMLGRAGPRDCSKRFAPSFHK